MCTLTPPEDYHLAQSVDFLTGFTPQPAGDIEGAVQLRFATPLSPDWTPTAITISQPGPELAVEWSGDVLEAVVVDHVARILSIDVDGTGFSAVADGDPVIRKLVDADRGFRPPLFWSPYEAAIWAVLSQRIQMSQATRLKRELAEAVGTRHLDADLVSTPTPETLAALTELPKIPAVKLERLRAVASAAIDGLLDPGGLRSLPVEQALDQLQSIDGIGPFSAELILVRGAGAPDVFPTHERRLHAAMRDQYGKPDASLDDLKTIAARWAPYRSRASFQLRSAAERAKAQ